MRTMTASEARKSLFPLLAQVNEDHDVVRITSKAGNAGLISEADHEVWQATRHLFSTPGEHPPAAGLDRGVAGGPAGHRGSA